MFAADADRRINDFGAITLQASYAAFGRRDKSLVRRAARAPAWPALRFVI
jgi:hypothetical protein